MSLVPPLQNVKWRKEEEVRWTDIAKLSSPKLWSYLSFHKSRTKKVRMNVFLPEESDTLRSHTGVVEKIELIQGVRSCNVGMRNH